MDKPCRLPEPYFSLYLPSLFLCRHTSMFLRCWWDSNPQGHTILFLTSILYKTRPICHSATAPLKKLTYCISQRFSQPNVLNIITNLSKNNEQEFRVAKIRFFFRTAKTLMFFLFLCGRWNRTTCYTMCHYFSSSAILFSFFVRRFTTSFCDFKLLVKA